MVIRNLAIAGVIGRNDKISLNVVGFEGAVEFDANMPDGTPRKLLDVSRLTRLGWRASTGLEAGITRTYDWFLNQAPVASTR